MTREQQIFKKGSTTYYFSSKFFPKSSKEDVFKLYSFVRLADDFVDKVPSDIKNFNKLEKAWKSKLAGKKLKSKKKLLKKKIKKVVVKVSKNNNFLTADHY